MNYLEPKMEIVELMRMDVITVSDGGNIDNGTGNGTGWVPNPNS